MIDNWWVTRPKRKLDSIPENLATFCSVALGNKWVGNRGTQIAFEDAQELNEIKREGERRDHTGSGGRTHAAMMYSLGLWFEKNDKVFLTWAGETIMNGGSTVAVLKDQVLKFQYPSAYSLGRGVQVTERFHVHPFIFLLRLLADSRIGHLTIDEISAIVMFDADDDSERCFENVVQRIIRFRGEGTAMFTPAEKAQRCIDSLGHNNYGDVANTMMNWLDYTRLVYREPKTIGIAHEAISEVLDIISRPAKFIPWDVTPDVFQRQYGLDPGHQKDTRNLLNTGQITSNIINRHRILQVFFKYASLRPVARIDDEVINAVCEKAGTGYRFTQDVLSSNYPHGSINGFLTGYRDMAFKGQDESREFEIATTSIFKDVFGYNAIHLGQGGAKTMPDVLLISDNDGYQSIIDNKAYSRYSISGDHRNRMVHNYLEGVMNYNGGCTYPIGFFSYISGGFGENIDKQIKSISDEAGVPGSGITVGNFINLIEQHLQQPYSHSELREIFSLDRQVLLSDLHH